MHRIFAFYRAAMLTIILSIALKTRGQTPPAPAPGPPPPPNVTAVLEKAGQFTTLIRLLQSTQVGERIDSQLNNSNAGLTLFAPSDNAFSGLPPGTLNALTRQQQVTLLQYHIIPTLITPSQFQTESNPLSTQAGDSSSGQYPLNVTVSEGNRVNITTGIVNATVSGTVHSDGRLAVYQVDKVLLPLGIFRPSEPSPPPKAEKSGGSDPAEGPSSRSATEDSAVASSAAEWSVSIKGLKGLAVTVSIFLLEFLNI